jgi:hypothetical protein
MPAFIKITASCGENRHIEIEATHRDTEEVFYSSILHNEGEETFTLLDDVVLTIFEEYDIEPDDDGELDEAVEK